MNRRALLASVAGSGLGFTAGCLGWLPVVDSSECGTVELAHAAYERSQERLDLLVVAADDSSIPSSCSDDLAQAGYRVEATVDGLLRRVSVTEHHVFGDTYSTTLSGFEQ
ncbi:hypothetical protein [Natronorubrum aibiense]|uniref:Uncharacterized protein n=1 Tax=Natronorubrum aibiense TaxID=348826 RepID=A0A5P9NZN6_9EURY|nr:hypothetical protein [Natronorubrum aibiense]QFU81060.1 hypothetical protein GCU68_00045 [Natronorubrum aibiense]